MVSARVTRAAVAAGMVLSTAVAAACAAGGAPPAPAAPAAPGGGPLRVESSPPPDPAAHGANELGVVPVLMYHRITGAPSSVYDRTPADFRAELERLAREGYVPVTTADYAAGAIDVPAGAHPVVLTFDDGDPSQFSLTPEGAPAPGTAVAIMLEVAGKYPAFRPVGSFYVNADPFGDPGGTRTVPWLLEHGMEVGNHTLTHANLRRAGPEAAQREIAGGDRAIRAAAPGYAPTTISLPFGLHPGDPALAVQGGADGAWYLYRAALLVGSAPAPSPYAGDFDPLRVPRIRSQGPAGAEAAFGSAAWLDKLAADPGSRFTSDGVVDRISFPRSAGGAVAATFQDRALAY